MKIAGIATVGGDAPILNALLEGARRALDHLGFSFLYGFRGGYRGIITCNHLGNILTAAVNPRQGGTFLSSLRDSPLPSPPEKKENRSNC